MEPWGGHGINHARMTWGSLESGGQVLKRSSSEGFVLATYEGGHTWLKGLILLVRTWVLECFDRNYAKNHARRAPNTHQRHIFLHKLHIFSHI